MKLEHRILEVAKDSKESCDYCLLDFRASSFTFAPATHEMVTHDKEGDCVDISFICADCKKDLESEILPYCEKCGRLKKHREACFCNLLKDGKLHQPVSEDALIARSFSSRLETKTKELEKELSAKNEEVVTHLEALQVSEGWSKTKIDRIKELEVEVARLKEENQHLKEQQNGQVAQIEVKEPKRWSWLKIKK